MGTWDLTDKAVSSVGCRERASEMFPPQRTHAPHSTQDGTPYILWAQRGPQRPAGQIQEPVTASQGAPAEQLQALPQSNPKKPAGQATNRDGNHKRPRARDPCPACTQGPAYTQLTMLAEASPPASWAGTGPTDMVTGGPMLTPALLLTAGPKVALATP